MKRGKRCLPSRGPKFLTRAASVLLSFCLLFSLCPVSPIALAEDNTVDPAAVENLFPAAIANVVQTKSELYLDDTNPFDVTKDKHTQTLVTNGVEVGKNQTFIYFAVFQIAKMDDLKSACDDAYSLQIPGGLSWPNAKQTDIKGSVIITDEQTGIEEELPFFTLQVESGMATLKFEPWDSRFKGVTNVELRLCVRGCTFAPPDDPSNPTYDVMLPPDTTLTLTITENKPVPYQLKWTENRFDDTDSRFHWTLAYTPGNPTGDVKEPTHIEIPLDYKNGTSQALSQLFLESTFKITCAGVTRDLAASALDYSKMDESGRPLLLLPIPADWKDKSFTIQFETTRRDSLFLPNDDGSQKAGKNTVYNDARFVYPGDVKGAPVNAYATDNGVMWINKTFSGNGTGSSPITAKYISWTITVNTYDRNLTNLVLHDKINGGKAPYLGGPYDVELKTAEGAVSTPTFTSAGDDTYTLDFGAAPYSRQYTITYKTKILQSAYDNQGGTMLTASNKSWLEYEWRNYGGGGTGAVVDHKAPTSSKSPVFDRNLLQKSGKYNAATHTIQWTVTVNPYESNLTSGTVTDDLPKGLTYVPNTFQCAGGKVALTTVSDDGKSLTFATNDIGKAKVTFTFDTVLDPTEFAHYGYNGNNISYKNTICLKNATVDGASVPDNSAEKTVPTTSKVLEKTAVGYDYNTHLLTWRITLNQNGMAMPDAILTDTLPKGLTYLYTTNATDGLTPSDPNKPANADAMAVKSAQYVGNVLTVALTNVHKDATVQFVTKVDPDKIDEFLGNSNAPVKVTNTVKLDRVDYPTTGTAASAAGTKTDLGGTASLYTASATQNVVNKMLMKSGKLSADKLSFEYEVLVNMNGINVEAFALKDTLPGGTRLNQQSVKLYQATVQVTNGAVTFAKGEPIEAPFTYDAAANLLTLPLTEPAKSCRTFLLSYRVDILDFTKGDYTNHVSLFGATVPGADPTIPLAPADASAAASAMRRARGGILLTVTDKVSGFPVGNLRYTLLDDENTEIDSAVTGADGTVKFVSLLQNYPYTLVLDRSTLPTGYKVPDGISSVTVERPLGDNESGIYKVTAQLDRVTTSLAFTKVSAMGPALAGVPFTLTSAEKKADGNPIYTHSAKTGADGSLTFDGIYYVFKDGYTLKETTAPAGHTAVTLTGKPVVGSGGNVSFQRDDNAAWAAGQNGKVTITDPVITSKGTILVYKYNELTDAPISGIEFKLYDGNKLLQTKSTDAGGVVIFSELALDKTYTVKESPHPDYRPAADRTVTLTDNHTSERLSWANRPLPKEGALTIYKYDATTENHAAMADVTFTLSLNGAKVDEKKTNANGKVEFTGLKLDVKYTVTETTPEGYQPTSSRDFTLTNANEGDNSLLLDWSNVRYGDLTIHKYDATGSDGAPMPGVTFTLSDENGTVATVNTDANGNAVFTHLLLNRAYTVSETVPEGYQPVADKLVTLTGEQYSQTIAWPNVRYGDLTIHKYDATGGGSKAMSGVAFTLYLDGVPVQSHTTDADGWAVFTGLTPGKTYTVSETVPEGYQAVADKLVTLTSAQYSQTIEWPNLRKGEITIYKYENAIQTPIPNVTFTLYLDGVEVAAQATDANGLVTFTGLTPGKEYMLRETVPTFYLPTSDRYVTLSNEQYSVVLDWPNYRSGGGGGGGGGTPSPSPAPSASPSPAVSPSPSPSVSPSPSASPAPSPSPVAPASPQPSPAVTNPPASPSPAPTTPPTPPYIRPDLDPGRVEDVLDLVDRAEREPDIVIRDRETLQEEYPEFDIDDLPTPLYWGPDVAVIETEEEELVIIDSDLIPLGSLPQTGTTGTSDAFAVLLPAGLSAAAVLCLLLTYRLRKRRDD